MDRLITAIALPVTGIALSLLVSCNNGKPTEAEAEAEVEVESEPEVSAAEEKEIGVNKPDTEEEIAALRERLSPMEFEVTQESGTERAFTGKYWDNKKPGIYVDIVDGKPLFSSTDKFDSGTGWPSFSRPLEGGDVVEYEDTAHGMVRVEVRSKSADSHLGHVFPYQNETGLRYCINSASLKFVPAEKLEEEGLGKFRSLFAAEKEEGAGE